MKETEYTITFHPKKVNYQNIDGIKIFEEYITKFYLLNLYSNMYHDNILKFEFDFYDYIIIGDVLDHIHVKPAQMLIKSLEKIDSTISKSALSTTSNHKKIVTNMKYIISLI